CPVHAVHAKRARARILAIATAQASSVSLLGAAAFAIAVTCLALTACAPSVRRDQRTPRAGVHASILRRVRERRDATAAGRRSLEVLQATHAALRSGLPLAPALRLALERTPFTPADPFHSLPRRFQ